MTRDQVADLINTNADVARCYKKAADDLATVVAHEKRVASIFGRWALRLDVGSAQRSGVEFCESVSRACPNTTTDGRVAAAGAALIYLAAYEDSPQGSYHTRTSRRWTPCRSKGRCRNRLIRPQADHVAASLASRSAFRR